MLRCATCLFFHTSNLLCVAKSTSSFYFYCSYSLYVPNIIFHSRSLRGYAVCSACQESLPGTIYGYPNPEILLIPFFRDSSRHPFFFFSCFLRIFTVLAQLSIPHPLLNCLLQHPQVLRRHDPTNGTRFESWSRCKNLCDLW